MKKMKILGLSLACLLPMASHAAVLATPPWDFNYGADDVYCTIVNMGSKVAKGVVIETVTYSGVVVDTTTADLAAGEGTALAASSTASYCRFKVPGSAKKFRAMAGYGKSGTVAGFILAQ